MALDSIRKIARNTASLLASDMTTRATIFVLYALVGRRLGAHEFGQMSLALTLFSITQLIASAGLRTLVTREVAKDREKTGLYLSSGSAVVLLSSLLAMSSLWLFVKAMGYSPDTAGIILLLALGLFPYSLSAVCEGIFQAWERMHYIAFANLSVNVAKVVVAALMLGSRWGLPELIGLLVLCYIAVLVVEWAIVLTQMRPRMSLDLTFGLGMVRTTVTFLGIDVVISLSSSASVLMLSKLADETQVGIYSAAAQLMVPVVLFFNSTTMSVFPVMSRGFEPTFSSLKRIAERLIEMLLAAGLPVLVGLLFMSPLALSLIYGHRDLTNAATVLPILAWTIIPTALTAVLGQVLLASMRERVNLRIVMVDAAAMFVLSFVLISQFGMIGAAVSSLLVRAIDLAQHLLAIHRLPVSLAYGRLLWKPLVAALCMAGYLAVMKDQQNLITAVSAVALYAAVLSGLAVWSAGGIGQLRLRYLELRSGSRVEL